MKHQPNSELVIAAVAVTVLFFILVGFIVSYFFLFRRKRKEHKLEMHNFKKAFDQQLLHARVEVQETTYAVLSKELHDNVGQLLSTSKMLLGLTERNLHDPPDTLITATATVAKAISELRSLSKSLDKEWLEQFSFTENLSTEIARINKGVNIHAKYVDVTHIPLPSDEQIILFRVVQESIQNALKHANPHNIDICLQQKQNEFFITITDDGDGFTTKDLMAGMGLKNMRKRTELLRGNIAWDSKPGAGTTVMISLPINPTEK